MRVLICTVEFPFEKYKDLYNNKISRYFDESLNLAYLINFYTEKPINSFFIVAAKNIPNDIDIDDSPQNSLLPVKMLNNRRYTVYLDDFSDEKLQKIFIINNVNYAEDITVVGYNRDLLHDPEEFTTQYAKNDYIVPNIKKIYDIKCSSIEMIYIRTKLEDNSQVIIKHNTKHNIHKRKYDDEDSENEDSEGEQIMDNKANYDDKVEYDSVGPGQYKYTHDFVCDKSPEMIGDRLRDYNLKLEYNLIYNNIDEGVSDYIRKQTMPFINYFQKIYISDVKYINDINNIKDDNNITTDDIQNVIIKIKKIISCGHPVAVNIYDKYHKQCIIYGWEYKDNKLMWKVINTTDYNLETIPATVDNRSRCSGIDIACNTMYIGDNFTFYGPYYIQIRIE